MVGGRGGNGPYGPGHQMLLRTERGSRTGRSRKPRERPLRRDLLRNTNLDGYTDADITDVVWNLNSMPRKCLAYQTPIEVFAANLGVALEL